MTMMTFISTGGAGRVCFLGDEETVEPTVLRATGDVVRRDDSGNLFYEGRRDVRFAHSPAQRRRAGRSP